MKLNNVIKTLFLLIIVSVSSCVSAEENIDTVALNLTKYINTSWVIKSNMPYYEKVILALKTYSVKEQTTAYCALFRSICGASIPVLHKTEKINYMFERMLSGEIKTGSKFWLYIVQCVDSRTEDTVFDNALKLLSTNSDFMMSTVNKNGKLAFRLNIQRNND